MKLFSLKIIYIIQYFNKYFSINKQEIFTECIKKNVLKIDDILTFLFIR